MKDLTVGNPMKVIVRFTIPILLGNLFNLAYNLADIRIIGSYLGHGALASVASVSTLSDLVVGFVFGLGHGFSVLTARCYGMKEPELVRKNFARSIVWGVGIAILVSAGSLLGLQGILDWLNVGVQQRAQATEYISVILSGLVFGCLYNVLASGLRAIGDSITPLILLIFSAVLNVILDILCVGKWGMGIQGAAYATVFAQMVSAVLCLVYALCKYPIFRFKMEDLHPFSGDWREMLAGGFSMGLMSCLVSLGTVSLQTAINTFSSETIVAHAAARKITSFYMLPFGVLGVAMTTYTGQNYGAKQIDRIKQGLKITLLISYGWVVFVQILSYTICPAMLRAITATQIDEVVQTGWMYLKVDTIFYALVPTITILRNSLQGMGDHTTPIISSSLELVGKVLIAYLLTPILAYWGIIWAEPIVWAVMVIPLIVSMVKIMRVKEPATTS